MDDILRIVFIAVCVGLLVFIFGKPIKLLIKLLFNAIGGWLCLLLLNTIGGGFGIALALTPLNCIVTGVFGLPGLAVLLVLQYLQVI